MTLKVREKGQIALMQAPSYTLRVGDRKSEDMAETAETIPIIYLPCRFGGIRAYFICPGDGTYCKRRVTKLHLTRRYFLCRHCNKLAYASQYEHQWQRALRKASKIKQRLGIDVGIGDPLLDKPKGMWIRTFDHLLNQMLQVEILANEAKANMFKRLAQIKNDR